MEIPPSEEEEEEERSTKERGGRTTGREGRAVRDFAFQISGVKPSAAETRTETADGRTGSVSATAAG